MNKSEQREVQKARQIVSIDRSMAATSLANLHRAASKRSQAEIEAVFAELGLRECMVVVNGCYVAKAAA
jgi:hypothetical protein